MKKTIILLSFLLSFVYTNAQNKWKVPNNLNGSSTYSTILGGLNLPNGAIFQSFSDTTAANLSEAKYHNGSVVNINGVLHIRRNNKWEIGGSNGYTTTTSLSDTSYKLNKDGGETVFLFEGGGSGGSGGSGGGTTETASEGLSKVGNDIRLGGTTINNDPIITIAAGKTLTFNSNKSFAANPALKGVSSNTSFGVGIAGFGTLTGTGVGVYGRGIYGSVFDGNLIAGQFTGPTALRLYGNTDQSSADTTLGTTVLVDYKKPTFSDTTGIAIRYSLPSAEYSINPSFDNIVKWESRLANTRSFSWKDPETNQTILKGLNSGKISFPKYGVGTFTGTPATYPAFDASGNLIESLTPPGIGNIDTSFNSSFIQRVTDSTKKYIYSVRSDPADIFVAFSDISNSITTSNDGITWTERTISGIGNTTKKAIWVDRLNKFLMYTRDSVYSSSDGINWAFVSAFTAGNNSTRFLKDIPELNLLVSFVSAGATTNIYTSVDGITWTQRTNPLPNIILWNDLAWSPTSNIMVAVSHYVGAPSSLSKWMTSSDGINWTSRTPTSSSFISWGSVIWMPTQNKFFTYAGDRIASSTDGISWTQSAISSSSSIKYIPEKGIAEFIISGVVWTSTDGLSFTGNTNIPSDFALAYTSYSKSRTTTIIAGNKISNVNQSIVASQKASIGLFSSTKDGLVPSSSGDPLKWLNANGKFELADVTAVNTKTLSNKRILPRAVIYSSVFGDFALSSDYNFMDATFIGPIVFISTLSSSFVDGEELTVRIRDNGTAVSMSFDSGFRFGSVAAPTTTVVGKIMYLKFIYDAQNSKFDLILKTENL